MDDDVQQFSLRWHNHQVGEYCIVQIKHTTGPSQVHDFYYKYSPITCPSLKLLQYIYQNIVFYKYK